MAVCRADPRALCDCLARLGGELFRRLPRGAVQLAAPNADSSFLVLVNVLLICACVPVSASIKVFIIV